MTNGRGAAREAFAVVSSPPLSNCRLCANGSLARARAGTSVWAGPPMRVAASVHADNPRSPPLTQTMRWSRTGTRARTLARHLDAVRAVAFADPGTLAVSGSDDGTIKMWNFASLSAKGRSV